MYSYTFPTVLLSVLPGALWWFFRHRRGRKLPPGPGGLPIIGHLHMLGTLPHRTLTNLSRKYGDMMTLYLGSVTTIVVTSPQAAELFLKTHDRVFASRPKLEVGKYLSYDSKGLIFTEYGPYWRNVRKFCTLELLSNAKIGSYAGMRREVLWGLVGFVKEAAVAREAVDITQKALELVEEMTYRMLFGCSGDDRFDLKGTIKKAVDLTGEFNLADFVPFAGLLDLQGLTPRLKASSKDIDKILDTIIDDHERDASTASQKPYMDFVDVMLSLRDKSRKTHDELSHTVDRTNMKAIVLDMISASIDTSSNMIDWTMAELLKHPRVMQRLQDELKTVIGVDRMVEETDLPKLDYLYLVAKESLRLHPIAPLLGPHHAMEDVVINGYNIPKNSRIIVNAWAIGRDPNIWSQNADEFFPERFIGSNIDVRGRDFQLLPFGAGRRGCPGMNLGLINFQFVVAQLVHCFNWELPNGMSPCDVDMREEFGMTLPRATHLLAIPTLSNSATLKLQKDSTM